MAGIRRKPASKNSTSMSTMPSPTQDEVHSQHVTHGTLSRNDYYYHPLLTQTDVLDFPTSAGPSAPRVAGIGQSVTAPVEQYPFYSDQTLTRWKASSNLPTYDGLALSEITDNAGRLQNNYSYSSMAGSMSNSGTRISVPDVQWYDHTQASTGFGCPGVPTIESESSISYSPPIQSPNGHISHYGLLANTHFGPGSSSFPDSGNGYLLPYSSLTQFPNGYTPQAHHGPQASTHFGPSITPASGNEPSSLPQFPNNHTSRAYHGPQGMVTHFGPSLTPPNGNESSLPYSSLTQSPRSWNSPYRGSQAGTNFAPSMIQTMGSNFSSTQIQSHNNHAPLQGSRQQWRDSEYPVPADPGLYSQPDLSTAHSPLASGLQHRINQNYAPPGQPYQSSPHRHIPRSHTQEENLFYCHWRHGDNVSCKFKGLLSELKKHFTATHLSGRQDAQIGCRWRGCQYSRRGNPTVKTIRRDSMWRHVLEKHLGIKYRKKAKGTLGT